MTTCATNVCLLSAVLALSIPLAIAAASSMAQMYVVKRDGTKEEVKFDAITQRLRPLCEGLDAKYIDPVPVARPQC